MKRLFLLAALAAGPALAKDPRVATRYYDPDRIVVVHARLNIQSTIEFGSNEHIENIAVGDSSSWQVTPNKHASLVFVKPIQATAHTNMTIVTDRRTYLFDLVASPRDIPVYMMRFDSPADPKPADLPAEAITPMPLPEPHIAPPPQPSPADLNFNWVTSGAKKLFPIRLFDDGQSTWLAWAKETPLPAILQLGPKKVEGPVNYTVKGDYIVVDGVPQQLVLREGKLTATLTPAPRMPKANDANVQAPALPAGVSEPTPTSAGSVPPPASTSAPVPAPAPAAPPADGKTADSAPQ